MLDLLDLALAPAGLLVQLGAGLEGDLPGLELGGLASGVGLALGIIDDPACPDLGGSDPAVGQDLVEGDPGDEPDAEANRRKQPNRIHVHLQRTHGVDVNESPKYLPGLTIIAGGSGVRTKEIPASAVCRRWFEPGKPGGRRTTRALGFRFSEGLAHRPLDSSRYVNEVETSPGITDSAGTPLCTRVGSARQVESPAGGVTSWSSLSSVSTRASTSPAARACSARARKSSSVMWRATRARRRAGSGMAGPPTSPSFRSM